MTEEQTNERDLWLKKKQKLNSSEPTSSEEPPPKKWRKCQHCLCQCLPKWKKCDCDCSKHHPCPKKPSKDDKTAGSSSSDLNNLKSFLTVDEKQIPRAKSRTQDGDTVQINQQLTLLSKKPRNNMHSEWSTRQHQFTIDTACPTSLVGAKYFKTISSPIHQDYFPGYSLSSIILRSGSSH